MVTYFEDHDVTLHQGDVRTVLADLPPASVNCVVTSPPYYGLRDYGVAGQIGLEPSPAEYVAQMVGVFAHVRRVLADDGVLWLNIGDSYSSEPPGETEHAMRSSTLKGKAAAGVLRESVRSAAIDRTKFLPRKNLMGMPWRVAFALQDDGWTLRNAVIWHKPNAMPESVTDRLSTRYEHVFLFAKSRKYWFDLGPINVPTTLRAPGNTAENRQQYGAETGTDAGNRRFGGHPTSTLLDIHETRNPGDVWDIPTSGFHGAHFATFPQALVRRCILAGCPEDGTVLDPFAGSGTTLMVARQLGRKSVGIELNPDYCDITVKRIGDPVFDFSAGAS